MAKKKPKPSYREVTLDDLIASGIRYHEPEPDVAPEPEQTPRSWARVAGDVGISALKGAISVPEAAVGLADIPTGGRVGRTLEDIGFRPKEAKAFLDEQYSDEQKQAFKNVNDAQGFGGKFVAALQNPSVVGHTVVESLPSMLAGGVVGRGVMAAAPRISAGVAVAAGEGVIGAGSAAEQIRQETPDGLLTPAQSGLATLSGVGTAAFGALGNRVAKSLGIHDVDTMLVGAVQNPATAKGVVSRVLKGAASEGMLEELPQSIQEQVLQNAALGKPLDEGVDQAAVLGLLSGAAMGGGANVLGGGHRGPAANEPLLTPPPVPPVLGLPAPTITVDQAGVAQTTDQRQALRESVAGRVGTILERGPLTKAANAANADVLDVEAKPAGALARAAATVNPEGISNESAIDQAPTDEVGQQLPGAGGAQLSDAAPSLVEPPMAGSVAPGVLGEGPAIGFEQAGASTVEPSGPVEGVAETHAPAVFPTYEAANTFRREQKARGATIDALPAPAEGGFVLARKGTAEYAAGEALREERRAAKERAAAGILDGDILNKQGKPFTIKLPAVNAAKKAGEGHEVVAVKGGFVVRPTVQESSTVAAAPVEPPASGNAGDLAGERIDAEWTAFAPDSGTRGVPRADMPQIKAEHRGAMVNFLGARGIAHEQVEIPATELKPTQAEFSPARVDKAKAFEGGERSILVSADGHVLDGHHQWLAKRDAGEPVKAIRLDAPIAKLIEEVRQFPSAETSDGATAPAAPASRPTGIQPDDGPVSKNPKGEHVAERTPGLSVRQAVKGTYIVYDKDGKELASFRMSQSFWPAHITYAEGVQPTYGIENEMQAFAAPIRKAELRTQEVPESESSAPGSPLNAEVPSELVPKRPREKKVDREDREREEARAGYFKPGNVVRSYGGQFDRVISYQPATDGNQWSVTVQAVKKMGAAKFEEVPDERPRTHSTQPTEAEMRNGPAGRMVAAESPAAPAPAPAQPGAPKETPAGVALFSRGAAAGMSVEAAQRVVDAIKAKWKNAPRVVVVPDLQHADVPEEVRDANAAQRSQGASGEPEGFFFRGDVFIVAGQLATELDVARVLFHESLGHFGLRGAFGADLLPILQQLVGVRRGDVAAKAREYGLDMNDLQDRLMAAEEVLAELAQTVPELGFVQRAIAAIRSWLRRNLAAYKNLELSDAEIVRDFILPARGWVQRGRAPARAPRSAAAFSLGESEDSAALRELSKADDLFALPKSSATTVEGIAKENDAGIVVKKLTPFAGRVDYQLTMPDGGFARLFVREPNPYGPSVYDSTRVDGEDQALATERPGVNPDDVPPTGDVWIDVSLLSPGGDLQLGAKVYNIAATYAHNTGRIFIGDPNGLSKTALRRRLEHMISSALKFGTTAHLAPHTDQVAGGHGVPALKWVYGDHVGNVKRMIAASVDAMDNAFPASQNVVFDPKSGTFSNAVTGRVLQRGQLAGALRRPLEKSRAVAGSAAAQGEAGWRTMARAAVFRAIARGEGRTAAGTDGRSDGLLAQLLQHAPRRGIEDLDGAIFYSRSAGGSDRRDRGSAGTSGASLGRGVERDRAQQTGGAGTDGLNDPRDFRAKATQAVSDLFDAPGAVGWWHKTVGTMHNLAKRSPQFGRVFDAVQTFLSDVSAYATEAADLAPSLLPKLETWRDIGKSPISAQDTKAIAAPIFEGTLTWARDADGKLVKMADLEARYATLSNEDKARIPQAGVVFTDAELKATFNSTPEQIRLYREFRAAVDQSLNRVTISEMLRFGGKDVEAVRGIAMDSGSADAAGVLLRDHLLAMAEETPARADVLIDSANKMIEKADRAKSLIGRGYAPLSRFGNYTVDVLDEAGERAFFGMFESRAEANRMARRMRENYPTGTITQGTVSQQAYKLFSGITPETLELFGEMVGLEAQGEDAQHQMFQQYLKLAKANRSAMKRLIERKGIAGYNEDAGRVLAGFVYSNARLTSTNLHTGEINQAAADIPKTDGELKDMAVKLADYVRNPQEEAQALRGMLFAQYLGGSLASAMVNMTQPIAVTMPYLSQWGGAVKAAGRMRGALADVLKKSTGDARLDAALKKAEEEGIVAPQEVHQLMAQAQGRGALRAGDGTAAGNLSAKAQNVISKISLAWGKPFAAAEQFNRRVTFIAAYRTAVAEGIENPSRFAEEAIRDTQFVYNKGNKPQWARGAIGGTLFTFKQYSISYMELLHRMATTGGAEGKKAALFSLAMLFLMGGAGGLPFVGDAEDVLDGIMQRLGYSFSTKQARRQFFIDVLGADAAAFVERGVSGLPGVPIDVAGRLGMGNLIPGTGLLTKKQDYGRDVAEVLGPAGDLAQRAFQGAGQVLSGQPLEGLTTAAPTAVRNVAKAFDMYQTGMYRDQRGRKVIDVDGYDALVKAVGFQPSAVAQVQDANATQQNLIGQNKLMKTELADSMAAAVFERDLEKQQDVRSRMLAWNKANPHSPVTIDMVGVRRRVIAMRQSKAERIEKSAPKAIRGEVRAALQEGSV